MKSSRAWQYIIRSCSTKQEEDGNKIHCQRCLLCLGSVVTDQGIYVTHCDWVMVVRSTCDLSMQLLGASADTKDAMVFQIQRSKLQVLDASHHDHLQSIELKDTWKSFENYLARRLISFSRSNAAFQFKIVDRNKKAYLTVSLHQQSNSININNTWPIVGMDVECDLSDVFFSITCPWLCTIG